MNGLVVRDTADTLVEAKDEELASILSRFQHMTNEELEARIAFEKDPDAWLEEAERKFEERIDIMEAIINGKMGPENMTYADMVV